LNAVRKAKPRRAAPVYLRVERLVRPETGEVVGALVPMTKMDFRTMRERRYVVGKELRADLKQSRNPMFYRLAHALGGWLADNVEGFEGLGQHAALKRLQELSGIGCETVEYDLPGIGKLTRTEAQSLNFEDMDEGQFSLLWQGDNAQGGWIGWLRLNRWGGLSPERMEEVERIIMGEHYE
jgi:hypothetical protein